MYAQGEGVKQDFREARHLFQKAADQGDDVGQSSLGRCYAGGLGVKQDFVEAGRWWRKAAKQGDASAQFDLGVMHRNGDGVKQDWAEAAQWFRKAAEGGHPIAKKEALLVEDKIRNQRQNAPASQFSSAPRTCAACGLAEAASGGALKPCSRCKAVVYCGKECQAQHWNGGGHREVCK
jgi:TPR repeat protein